MYARHVISSVVHRIYLILYNIQGDRNIALRKRGNYALYVFDV